MHHKRIWIGFGVVIALTPFVGLPYSFLMVLLPLLGAMLILLTFILRSPAANYHETNQETIIESEHGA